MIMDKENTAPSARGRLYVVATPIGNLEDLTIRALKTLREVDVIACEDTRHSLKLLHKYHLKKKLISYFHPREKQKIPLLIDLLKNGKDVALVSDAGTPGISDPGFPLIQAAIRQKIQVIPIPGASALTAALSAAGLPTHRFLFLGFPPVKKQATLNLLQSLADESATLVFYLPARKIMSFLEQISLQLQNRTVVIAREITKLHEEFLRGTPEKLIEQLQRRSLKGEITLMISGKTR